MPMAQNKKTRIPVANGSLIHQRAERAPTDVLTDSRHRAKLNFLGYSSGSWRSFAPAGEVVSQRVVRNCAPVAQLDRALAYEARGREFESLRAYQLLVD